MQKILPVIIIAVLIVGVGAFYGGIKYQQNTRQNFFGENLGGQNFRNLSPEERQARLQQFGADGTAAMPGGMRDRNGAGFASGKIIAKDDKSITIKLPDANQSSDQIDQKQSGSKIIFFSESTDIAKSVKGATEDLIVGEQVIINGTQNEDGSITAKSIQMR